MTFQYNFSVKNIWIFFVFFTWKIQLSAQIGFLPYQNFENGAEAEVVAIGDLNNDDLNDITLGLDDDKLLIFYQDSNGILQTPISYTYPNNTPVIRCIAIGDVNSDSLNDLIIGYGDSLRIFYQDTGGTLSQSISYFSGAGVDGIKTGDLNNDGLIDIAVSHWNSLFIKIFYQNGNGSFTKTTYTKPQGGYDEIDISDVNSDGLNDVIYMSGQTSTSGIYVYLQNTSGLLNSYVAYSPPTPAWYGVHGIAVGDLNNDSLNDVAGSYGTNQQKIIIWFQDSVSFDLQDTLSIDAPYGASPIEISDLNCDGKNEIIVVDEVFITIFEQDSSDNFGTFSKFYCWDSNILPQSLSIGDINNDKRPDIAVADWGGGMNLLINSSKPVNFISVDTIFTIDTISVYNDTLTGFYLDQYVDSHPLFNIYHWDFYDVKTSVIIYQTEQDSLFKRTGIICGKIYCDTIFTDTVVNDTIILQIDTFLTDQYSDTIFVGIESPFHIPGRIKVFPNPSNDHITIDNGNYLLLSNYLIKITNPLYQVFFQNVINQQQFYIDITTWSSGIYFINIYDPQNNLIDVRKIILQ